MQMIPVATLRRALEILDPVVPKKTPISACQYILVGGGQAVANNLEVAAVLDLPEAEGEPVGIFPDTARAFLERVPGEALATLQTEGAKVTIEAGGQRATFKALAADKFPTPPQVEAEHEAVADGEALIKGLQAVVPFAYTKGDRPALTGVCLTLGDSPRLATGDGFRLRIEELPGRLPGEGNLLIPREAVRPLAHLWKHGGKQPDLQGARSISDVAMAKRLIRLSWKGRHLKLNFGEVTVVVQLVQATFPNYELLVPTEFVSHVSVVADDLRRAVESAGAVVDGSKDAIRLQWAATREAGGQLHVAGDSKEAGEVTYTIPANCDPPQAGGRIALGCHYLLEYLRGKEGMVRISVNSENRPALFTHHGQANYVLMPMYVKWDGPSPFPQPPATPEASTEPTQDSGVDTAAPEAVAEPASGDGYIAQDTPRAETPAKPRPGTRKAGGKAKAEKAA